MKIPLSLDGAAVRRVPAIRRLRFLARRIALGTSVLCVGCSRAIEPTRPAPSQEIWTAEGEGWGDAAFDDSTVYFVGPYHDLISVNKRTGVVGWTGHTGAPGDLTEGRGVVIAGNTVVMGDWELYGFDRRTGQLRWRFQPVGGWGTGEVQLDSDGQTVYTGSGMGHAYAIDPTTGRQRWDVAVSEGDTAATVWDPRVSEGLVYVCVRHNSIPSRGGVVALDASTGAIRWSAPFTPHDSAEETGCVMRVVRSGAVVVGAALGGQLYAFDRLTGQPVWEAPADAAPQRTDLRPLAANDNVVVAGGTTGYITAYDPRSGRVLWRTTANWGSVITPIGIDGQRAYVTHFSGQLSAFDLSDGHVLWTSGVLPVEGEYPYRAAVDTDRLYIGGYHGLHALRKEQ